MSGHSTARRYSRLKVRAALADTLIQLALLAGLAFTPAGASFAAWVDERFASPYVGFVVFAAGYTLVLLAATLPLDFYSGFVLEHRFGLSNQTLGKWAWQRVKSFAVALVFGLPLGLAFYALIRSAGIWWWIPVGILFFGFSVLFAQLAPVAIFPLFYRFERIENQALEARLQALLRSAGLSLQGLYRFDMSRDTRKGNAALAGLGRTRRILLGDTLLENLSENEIEAVVAHEVGHHAHKHLWKTLVVGFLVELGGLALAALLHAWWVSRQGLADLSDLRGFPFLLFVLAFYGQLVGPLLGALSRRQEWQADRYALAHSRAPEALATALQKLQEQNLEDPNPPRWVVWLFHDHPPISQRVALIERTVQSERQTAAGRETV